MPSTPAPRNAPMIVPEPPAQRTDRADPETVQGARQTAQDATDDEIPDFDETGLDAHLRGTNEVTAGGDRVHPPTRLNEDELENERDANRPQALGDRVAAEDVADYRPRFRRHGKTA